MINAKNPRLFAKYDFDPFTNRIKVEVRTEKADDIIYCSMRYYLLHEMARMLQKRKMRIVNVYGDYDGGQFTLSAPRMIVVAQNE